MNESCKYTGLSLLFVCKEFCGHKDIYPQEKLYYACENGVLEVVRYLVESCGACITENAIRYTIIGGHVDILKYIVERIVDKTVIRYNWVIELASEYGHLEIVKYLVEECGSNVETSWAVKWASKYGHSDVVRYLVEHGADENMCIKPDFHYRYIF